MMNFISNVILPFIKKMCLSPIFTTIISCFPIIIGIVPVFFSEHFTVNGFVGYQSWLITILICIYSIGFIFQQYFQNEFRDIIDRNLENKMSDVEKLVRTMPPESFMEAFSIICDDCHKAYINIQNANNNIEIIEENIRLVLLAIIKLVHIYDKESNNTRYGINIMIFEDDYKTKNNINKQDILFTDIHDDINFYKGLLRLYNKLSVEYAENTENAFNKNKNKFLQSDSDFDNQVILIPIPSKDTSENGKHLSLPGAPTAYLTKNDGLFPDTTILKNWIGEYADFTETIAEEVQKHFNTKTNDHIKSFISIPLYKSDTEPVIAILNIHRNTTNILYDKEEEKVTYFGRIMNPIYNILIEMLIIYKQN